MLLNQEHNVWEIIEELVVVVVIIVNVVFVFVLFLFVFCQRGNSAENLEYQAT